MSEILQDTNFVMCWQDTPNFSTKDSTLSLLAKFGDDHQRFPEPSSVQALAGTCPVTDASGQRRAVKFRRACDLEFHQIAQPWAR